MHLPNQQQQHTFTMSPSSSAPGSHSSHSDLCSCYSDTLQPKDILKEPEDTVPVAKPQNTLEDPDDIHCLSHPLPQPNDIPPDPDDTLPDPSDILPDPDDILLCPENSTMSGRNRSAGRDVHIFDMNDRNTAIGGLICTNGITNENLYAMIEIFIFFDGEYILRNESDIIIEKDNSPLQAGNYYIHSPYKYLSNSSFLWLTY